MLGTLLPLAVEAAEESSDNPLIKLVPGLMIWTLICFAITFFVLRKYAFGPIQQLIDQRRERIRQSLQEADNARDEARRLLEEHRALMGEARGQAEEILAEARRVGEAQRERARHEVEEDRQRRMEETRRQIEAETQRALGEIRREVADLALIAAEKVTAGALDPQAQRKLIDDAIKDLDFSKLEKEAVRWPSPHRTYARALFDAAKERGRLREAHEEFTDFVESAREVPELRALLENPEIDQRSKQAALGELLAGGEELVRNFLLVLVEKGRATQIEEILRELDALVAAEERRLEVVLTTAYELDDDEAKEILAQIEQQTGRQIEATRRVDPALIGGFVLQAGSMRADASVRGRFERLRQEIKRS